MTPFRVAGVPAIRNFRSAHVIINVTSIANKAACLPLEQATCSYVSGNNVLQFNCGGSTLVYQRQ